MLAAKLCASNAYPSPISGTILRFILKGTEVAARHLQYIRADTTSQGALQ